MQPAPQPRPMRLALPLMYVAPNEMLAYGYAEAASLDSFEQIRKAAQARGAKLKLQYAFANPGQGGFSGAFVVDLSAATAGLQQISRELQALPDVATLQIGAATCGLAASESSELEVAGTPVVVIARDLLGETHRRLVESLGQQAETSLFEAGNAAGRQAAAAVPTLLSQLGCQLTPRLIRERFRDLQVFGWATIISLHVDDRFVGEAKLADDFEATAWHGQARTSECHWIRGFIAGAISSLHTQPFDVTEPECQAKGDAYCRMVFRPSA